MSLVEDYLHSFWELELEEEPHRPYTSKSASDLLLKDLKTDEWKPQADYVGNSVTRDLLRLCDEWDLEADVHRDPGGPYHASGCIIEVACEDGCLTVEVTVSQDEENQMEGYQTTRIQGKLAYDRFVKGLLDLR
jgi:hypothetical protein